MRPPEVMQTLFRSPDVASQHEVVCRPASRAGMTWSDKLRYAWNVARTRILWGRRLYALGERSVLGKAQQCNHPKAITVGSRVTICDGFVLADLLPGTGSCPKITIGDGVIALFRLQCNAALSIVIEENVLLASNVLLTDSDHVVEPGGVPVTRSAMFISRPVRIERNCWIGQNVVILKGVTVGHDSIIGANSVVTGDVPPCCVFAGNPARKIKSLKPASPSNSREQPWKP